MSTRSTVRIFDQWDEELMAKGEEVTPILLYHHSDGYPTFMARKVHRFMKKAYTYLKHAGFPYWWDTERVAAVLIALSLDDYEKPIDPADSTKKFRGSFLGTRKRHAVYEEYRPKGGVPEFVPCAALHGDLEYVYDVYLSREQGKYRVEVRRFTSKYPEDGYVLGEPILVTPSNCEKVENQLRRESVKEWEAKKLVNV
jgi:hypothetical protein